MSNLAQLREEVRQLIGPGAYERLYKPEWADEGLLWACDQVASLLGLTRTDIRLSVVNKQVVIPADAVKVTDVRVG